MFSPILRPAPSSDRAGPLAEDVDRRQLGRRLGFGRAPSRTCGSPPPGCGCTSRPRPGSPKAGRECASPRRGSRPRSGRRRAAPARRRRAGCRRRRPPAASSPRSRAGAASPCSAAISTAPPHSPPTAKPWTRRSTISADRRPDADLRVGRQQADQHGRDAHQDEAQHQQALAPDPVAIMAEHDPADRPRDEAERIGGEGEQGPGQRVEGGEEQLVEHQARRPSRRGRNHTIRWSCRSGSPSPPAAAALPAPSAKSLAPLTCRSARRRRARPAPRRGGW